MKESALNRLYGDEWSVHYSPLGATNYVELVTMSDAPSSLELMSRGGTGSCCLSFASQSASSSEHHQFVMSSDHLLGGLPQGRSPSTIPNITVFTSH